MSKAKRSKAKGLAKAFQKMSHRKVEPKEPLRQQQQKLVIPTHLKVVNHMRMQF